MGVKIGVLGVVTAALLLATSPAAAQQLWDGTRAGMSPAEVRHLYPDAAPTMAPASAESAGQTLLTVARVDVAGEPFRVAFVFKHDALQRVGLIYLGAGNFDALLPLYNKVRAQLEGEYGAPTTARSERGGLTNNEEHTWRNEHRVIQMSMTSYLDRDAIFAIRYRAAQ